MIFVPLASGPFFSLNNTDFVVWISFLLFIGVLVYFGVPKLLGKMLDDRAAKIQTELDDARKLREEAQTLLASFERKQKEVAEQAEHIVTAAKAEAQTSLELAKEELKGTIARRLQAATDQISSAEQSAVREVRDTAITVATQAAGSVIAGKMDDARSAAMIDSAIAEVKAKLH